MNYSELEQLVNQKKELVAEAQDVIVVYDHRKKEKILILDGTIGQNAYKQAIKTQEELDEMKQHIFMQQNGINQYFSQKKNELVNVNEAIKDDIGDQLVTLIIQCEQQGTSLTECLNIAYNEIKDRTGKTVNGTYIKD